MRVFATIYLSILLTACSGPASTPVAQYEHARDGALAASIATDASISLVSSLNEGLLVWDLERNELRYQWSHEGEGNNFVTHTQLSPDNSFAVTADRDAFALWSLDKGEPVGFWRIDASSIRDVAVSNQGRAILVGRGNGQIMFFEPQTGRRLEFLAHQEKINSVALSPNGFYALSGGNDYVAYLWDTRSGQVIHRFTHSSRVTKVALDPKGRYAFTADSKRDARIWNVQTGEVISNLDYFERQKIFSAVVFSDDGEYLLTGSPSRKINLWRVEDGEQVREWMVTPKPGTRPRSAVVYALAFIDDEQIISESSSGLAEVWSR